MSRVFITGSTDGLGLMAARLLVGHGHQVTLRARNDRRAADMRRLLPQAEAVVVGELSSVAETRWIAEQVNALGRFDAVIHNAGVGYRAALRPSTVSRNSLRSMCSPLPRQLASERYDNGLNLIGTPDEVAARMGEAIEEIGGDGFLISTPLQRISRRFINEVCEGLVPALQTAGESLTADGQLCPKMD
jgi:NAD(P)-dependent dehydrogenase (short-subunit alcohol dehydrogenase family)